VALCKDLFERWREAAATEEKALTMLARIADESRVNAREDRP
jgi:hypothetical protein